MYKKGKSTSKSSGSAIRGGVLCGGGGSPKTITGGVMTERGGANTKTLPGGKLA